jgi:serine protease Do
LTFNDVHFTLVFKRRLSQTNEPNSMMTIRNVTNRFLLPWAVAVSLIYAFFPWTMASSATTYPLPLSELDIVVSRWLDHAGFEVTRTPGEMAGVRLEAAKNGQRCMIQLGPSSPLASSADIVCFRDTQSDAEFEKHLYEHIARYVAGQDNEPVQATEEPAQTIPTVVLSKIESVVCLKAKLADKEIQFSGFLVDEDGLILSTAHDVKELKQMTVVLHDGREVKGDLVKIDFRRDLALVDIDGKFACFISVADSRNLLGMGEYVFSVGCPINLGGTVSPGFVNGPPRLVDGLPLWQVHMEIQPGSSGSPVFDSEGNLVAIVKGRYRGTDSVGFLIPIETIVEFSKKTEP